MSNHFLEERAFAMALPSPIALAALQEVSPLQLRYSFTTSPNPIRASTDGANPNVATIQVIVSNPLSRPVPIGKITITIPVGENSARTISAASALPAPVYDTAGPWTISREGGKIIIEPTEDASGEMTDPILFSIPGIRINSTFGVVPITIEEVTPSGQRVSDPVTYTLVKLPSNFPVIDFHADPPILDDLTGKSRLFWTCSSDGQQLSYSLSSEGWKSGDCLNSGVCLSCADGARGIETPELTTTTTFTLSMYATESTGSRVLRGTLTTTVRVEVPFVSQNSRYVQIDGAGRILRFHWLATNAVRCSLLLGNREIVSDAPANTYKDGYLVLIDADPGTYQLSLVAYGASGAQATHIFPNVTVRPSVGIELAGGACALAITSDGRRAFVSSHEGEAHWGSIMGGGGGYVRSNPYIEVIDLVKVKLDSVNRVGVIPGRVALTSDGRFAVAAYNLLMGLIYPGPKDSIAVVDTSTMAASVQKMSDDMVLSVAPVGGSRVLVSMMGPFGMKLGIQDVSTGTAVRAPVGINKFVLTSAVTPDGKTALAIGVTSVQQPIVTKAIFIDLDNLTPFPEEIDLPEGSTNAVITPDGAYALVIGSGSEMAVIDVRNRRREQATIPIGNSGIGPGPAIVMSFQSPIGITADGKIAVVLRESGTRLAVIDVRGRRLMGTLPIPPTISVGISPDGKNTLLVSVKSAALL